MSTIKCRETCFSFAEFQRLHEPKILNCCSSRLWIWRHGKGILDWLNRLQSIHRVGCDVRASSTSHTHTKDHRRVVVWHHHLVDTPNTHIMCLTRWWWCWWQRWISRVISLDSISQWPRIDHTQRSVGVHVVVYFVLLLRRTHR
jgi:hypothetical protein